MALRELHDALVRLQQQAVPPGSELPSLARAAAALGAPDTCEPKPPAGRPEPSGQGPGGDDKACKLVADVVDLIATALLSPPKELFADMSGAPKAPEGNPSAYWEATALRLRLLRALLPLLGAPKCGELAWAGSGNGDGDEQARQRPEDYAKEPRRRPLVGIMEVAVEDEEGACGRGGSARLLALKRHQRQRGAAEVALEVAALYAPCGPEGCAHDGAEAMANGARPSSAPEGGLPAGGGPISVGQPLLRLSQESRRESLRVPSPWADEAAQRHAAALLQDLLAAAAGVGIRGDPGGGGSDEGGAGTRSGGSAGGAAGTDSGTVGSEGQLLRSMLCTWLLPRLREPLFAPHRHSRAQERGFAEAYSGPDNFQRALAARKLAWAARSLCGGGIDSGAAAPLLPLTLAASDDTAAAVSRMGATALHDIAAAAAPGALLPQRELLMRRARRLVVGCEEGSWPVALPAAVTLVLSVEPCEDVRSEGLHILVRELLTEAERAAHKRASRLLFMACLARVLPRLRLYAVRHLSRLAPLLLEWCIAHDRASRGAALCCLETVLHCCWPRAAAHGPVLWDYLQAAARAADLDAPRIHGGGGGSAGGGGVDDSGCGGGSSGAPADDGAWEEREALLRVARLVLAACGPPAPADGADVGASGGGAAAGGVTADGANREYEGPSTAGLRRLLTQVAPPACAVTSV